MTELARRAAAQVCFDGADITSSIEPYLLGLTYSDSESDEADDLQLTLQDRDGLWLERWMADALDAAASSGSLSDAKGEAYTVTAQVLNVRTGPGTDHRKRGTLAHGTRVLVQGMEGGWARIAHGGGTGYVSADYIKKDTGGSTKPGFTISATIVQQGWSGAGKAAVLDCGTFELDSVQASGPPSVVTIKGTALPYDNPVRQTPKCKAWEAYTLSGIAKEIAAANNMTCMYLPSADPAYDRVEQLDQSDIAFLAQLCRAGGISLKATSSALVLFDQREYEGKPAIRTITRGDGSYISYRLRAGKAQTQYASCRVSYMPPTGQLIEATVTVEDYKEDRKGNQQLEISARVRSKGQAKALAEKMLRLHNKLGRTASFVVPGDPSLLGGMTVQMEGWGPWSGRYIITRATHTLGSGGYTTRLEVRRTLEGY